MNGTVADDDIDSKVEQVCRISRLVDGPSDNKPAFGACFLHQFARYERIARVDSVDSNDMRCPSALQVDGLVVGKKEPNLEPRVNPNDTPYGKGVEGGKYHG